MKELVYLKLIYEEWSIDENADVDEIPIPRLIDGLFQSKYKQIRDSDLPGAIFMAHHQFMTLF